MSTKSAGSCPWVLHISFRCFARFSLDPRDRLGGLEKRLKVLVKNLRTMRVVYWVNVSDNSTAGSTRVVKDKGPLNGCWLCTG